MGLRKFSDIAGDISPERHARIDVIREAAGIAAFLADFGKCRKAGTSSSLAVWLGKQTFFLRRALRSPSGA